MRVFIIVLLLVGFVLADELVGKFGKLEGEVYVIRKYKQMKAYYGFNLYRNDIIITKKFAKAKVIFLNDTTIKVDSNRRLDLDKFLDENKKYTIKRTSYIKNNSENKSIKIKSSIIKPQKITVIKEHKKSTSFSVGVGSNTKTTSAKVTIK